MSIDIFCTVFPYTATVISEIVDVQSLRDWDASNRGSLLNAVTEMLGTYKHYQSSLLKGSRLEFDYNSLLEECSLDDVEVYVAGRNTVSSLFWLLLFTLVVTCNSEWSEQLDKRLRR